MTPLVHYVPVLTAHALTLSLTSTLTLSSYTAELFTLTQVQEDLSDLLARLDWADAHPDEVSAIAAAGQRFAQAHLTEAAALRALASAIIEGTTRPPN